MPAEPSTLPAPTTRSSPPARADEAAGFVLRGVPWEVYVALRETAANRRTRMTYLDGTLTLMSPQYLHERGAELLAAIVREVADAFDIEFASTRSTTFRRPGHGPSTGTGKEPDASFYLGDHEASIRGKATIDLANDPPPDLAIEVDNKGDSASALTTYARLAIPEVWRYDARDRTLWFGRLAGEAYVEADRSLGLSVLSPGLVLEILDAFEPGMGERAWIRQVRVWARDLAAMRES